MSLRAHEDRRYIALSIALVLLALIATFPVLEMGLNDDWSYAYTARQLATTGHWRYTGWTTPMLGVQGLLGALVIRLVGFSFTALRLTTSLFAVGCAVLSYRLARFFGLNPVFALFATLSSVLSPLFIPSTASFMTDVPGFFFLLVCFYSGGLAVETSQGLLWLTVLAVAGLMGGTVRQIVWGAPLLMIPAIIWLKRQDRRMVVGGAIVYLAVSVAIALAWQWSVKQSYFIADPTVTNLWEFLEVIRGMQLAAAARTALILLLPALIIQISAWRRLRRFESAFPVFVVFCVVSALWVLPSRRHLLLGNLISPNGILNSGLDALGIRPVIVSNYVFFGLASLAAGALAVFLVVTRRGPVVRQRSQAASRPHALALWLFGPFYTASILLLLFRSGYGGLLDRHLLFVLPAITLFLLWTYQHKMEDKVPVVGWVVLAVYAAYGVATTHDYLAYARARLTAATAITDGAVPRTAITAGLEYDGWSELEARGFVNEPRITLPRGAYQPRQQPLRPSVSLYWFWRWTPSIDPKYFVVYTRQRGLADAGYAPVRFSVWLPPSTRTVLTQQIAQE